MILHARLTRGLNAFAKAILMLFGLVVLPISASGQVSTESVQPASKPETQPPTALPRAEPTQPATERSVELTPAVTNTLPVNNEPRNVAATSETTSNADAQDQTERRLSRLEKMMERILSELQEKHVSTRGPVPPVGGSPYLTDLPESTPMSAIGVTVRARAVVSLSDLKKQRIDVEDELERLQDRLAKIDEQIAKLQSARSTKEPDLEKPQAR